MKRAEEWRSIPGYEGLYRVSDQGRVWSCRRDREMRPFRTTPGYISIRLSDGTAKRNWGVHQLVMLAFVGEPPVGMEVNHKDGDKTNNRAENLEYVTKSANQRHSVAHGLHGSSFGVRHHSAKLNPEKVRRIRALGGTMTNRDLGAMFGVSGHSVWLILHGRSWKSVP